MRSLQIHPPLSPHHALITVHQPPSKTRRRRNVMTTPADPPVAAPGVEGERSCDKVRGLVEVGIQRSTWVSGYCNSAEAFQCHRFGL